MASARYVDTLRLLAEAGVEFVVVGMAAGILQGVPATTLDLDIVHRRTPANVERLLAVLKRLTAVARHADDVDDRTDGRDDFHAPAAARALQDIEFKASRHQLWPTCSFSGAG